MVKGYRNRDLSATELWVWRLVFVSVSVFFAVVTSAVIFLPLVLIGYFAGGL